MWNEEWLASHSSFCHERDPHVLQNGVYMKKNVRETVREAVTPTVEALGYRIWDIEYSKIGADYHLEITIDADGGINIEDCERVHRAIDPILDECDPIEGFYYLEVSSPGVERELRTDAHILASIGERAELRLFAAQDGIRSFVGRLDGISEDGRILLTTDDGIARSFSRGDVSKLKTIYFEEE